MSFREDCVDGGVQAFSDVHIEDMWLPFFCNSTNINTSTMEIHETGYAWRYIRKLILTLFEHLVPILEVSM